MWTFICTMCVCILYYTHLAIAACTTGEHWICFWISEFSLTMSMVTTSFWTWKHCAWWRSGPSTFPLCCSVFGYLPAVHILDTLTAIAKNADSKSVASQFITVMLFSMYLLWIKWAHYSAEDRCWWILTIDQHWLLPAWNWHSSRIKKNWLTKASGIPA